jgi:hypothetical protein
MRRPISEARSFGRAVIRNGVPSKVGNAFSFESWSAVKVRPWRRASSASAAVIAAYARGLIDEQATVVMPGGVLQVTVLFEDDEIRGVRIAGTAERLAEVRVALPDMRRPIEGR